MDRRVLLLLLLEPTMTYCSPDCASRQPIRLNVSVLLCRAWLLGLEIIDVINRPMSIH